MGTKTTHNGTKHQQLDVSVYKTSTVRRKCRQNGTIGGYMNMVETRDGLALGMREAEVAQLRAVIDDMRDIIRHKTAQIDRYESVMYRIAKSGAMPQSTLCRETLADYSDEEYSYGT